MKFFIYLSPIKFLLLVGVIFIDDSLIVLNINNEKALKCKTLGVINTVVVENFQVHVHVHVFK